MVRQKIKFTEEMRLKRNSDLKDCQSRITSLKKTVLLILITLSTKSCGQMFFFFSLLFQQPIMRFLLQEFLDKSGAILPKLRSLEPCLLTLPPPQSRAAQDSSLLFSYNHSCCSYNHLILFCKYLIILPKVQIDYFFLKTVLSHPCNILDI